MKLQSIRQWKQGKKHGFGEELWKDDGTKYVGNHVMGNKHGKGKYIWQDGYATQISRTCTYKMHHKFRQLRVVWHLSCWLGHRRQVLSCRNRIEVLFFLLCATCEGNYFLWITVPATRGSLKTTSCRVSSAQMSGSSGRIRTCDAAFGFQKNLYCISSK